MVKKLPETVSVTIRFPRDLHKRVVEFSQQCQPPISFNSAVVRLIHAAFEAFDLPEKWDRDYEKWRASLPAIGKLSLEVSELLGILKKRGK